MLSFNINNSAKTRSNSICVRALEACRVRRQCVVVVRRGDCQLVAQCGVVDVGAVLQFNCARKSISQLPCAGHHVVLCCCCTHFDSLS